MSSPRFWPDRTWGGGLTFPLLGSLSFAVEALGLQHYRRSLSCQVACHRFHITGHKQSLWTPCEVYTPRQYTIYLEPSKQLQRPCVSFMKTDHVHIAMANYVAMT